MVRSASKLALLFVSGDGFAFATAPAPISWHVLTCTASLQTLYTFLFLAKQKNDLSSTKLDIRQI